MLAPSRLEVNTSTLKVNQPEYVCWMDVMGTRSIMSHSLERASNFIIRLHAAVLQSRHANQRLYPMLDGMYITSASQTEMLDLLRQSFRVLAYEFAHAKEEHHRFIPKASLSFGPVVHGVTISSDVSPELAANPPIRDSLLLGLPVIEAHQGERNAPPFGIYVDISARTFSPPESTVLPYVWWKWFNSCARPPNFLKKVTDYYDWCELHRYSQQYEPDRIKEHKAMALEYLR